MNVTVLTPARSRALNVLLAAHRAGRPVYVSNATDESRVYWQTAAWLTKNGLAVSRWHPRGSALVLTDLGRHVAGGGVA